MTAGLLGRRDTAQPLLTYLDGPARVELSGTTTANWVAKTANLLHDGYGGPDRIGLMLPLHWQTVCLLLGAVAAGSTVVMARSVDELEGCSLAFVSADHAEAAMDAGVDDVLACSMTPLATRLGAVPPMVLDAAAEIPGYGDHWGGQETEPMIELGGVRFMPAPLDVGPADRVLTYLHPATPQGLSAVVGTLMAGAALVLLAGEDPQGAMQPVMQQVMAAEAVTAWVDGAGLLQVREGV